MGQTKGERCVYPDMMQTGGMHVENRVEDGAPGNGSAAV